jgi:hypothetical protein
LRGRSHLALWANAKPDDACRPEDLAVSRNPLMFSIMKQ